MKLAKKAAEPTLHTVIEVVTQGFGRVEKRLDKVERRLDGLERRTGAVETRLGDVEDSNRHQTRRLGEIETKIDDMQEELHGLTRAFDHDTVMVMDHNKRIAKLEKVRA